MRRSPASVVVVAAPGPEGRARADFLVRGLRPSLGVRDEVVLVADGTPAGDALAAVGGGSLAARRDTGVRLATRDVVVLVCADSVAPKHAIDPLVAALDSGAIAAGPVHDLGTGRQGLTPPLPALASAQELREWTARWHDEHRGGRLGVEDLGEGVLAARRAHLQAVGCREGVVQRLLAAEGAGALGPAVVVQDSVWHHRGAPGCALPPSPQPLLSIVMIVKDEEKALPSSLASLAGLGDEVVVYDTGSSDGTVEIARAMGARVVQGYWDDHFGDARNRGLAHARGRWFLQVDADEQFTGDAASLRAQLEVATDPTFMVDVESQTESGFGTTYCTPLRRIGLREDCWFLGRLHEQIALRAGGVPPSSVLRDGRLLHSGYLASTAADKDKRTRNLRLAELATADEAGDLPRGVVLCNLARSQRFAGDNEGVLATAAEAWEAEHTSVSRRDLCATAATAAAVLERYAEAELWCDRLEEQGVPLRAAETRAVVLLAQERWLECLEAVRRIPDSGWDRGDVREIKRSGSIVVELKALVSLGRYDEAVDRLLRVVRAGELNVCLPDVLELFHSAPARLREYATDLPEELLLPTLAEVRTVPVDRADTFLDALYTAGRRQAAVVAAAAPVAPHLPLPRAVEWSLRLRAAGDPGSCPLVRIARAPERSPRDRVLAAALVMESFADETVLPQFLEAAELVPDAQADAVGKELRLLAPLTAARLLAV
ncbi:glycosyl transferase family 2 [Motilibacter rhizosphaerae]|uniref:Glycosyl transferase family 2 n=1 Tax=Motilibacter rhizosphaerae TaxID=598652 RepID=A0A4Q7NYD1_9ACTN|nr:glycosyltransferase family 2 protein [Motilibacter rhizosphaerae]RZS91402.1 glycosyl transferase family 2 [Motilibacter rhizosphaerae]